MRRPSAYSKTASAYNVAKAAIISLTRGLAWELGPHNIRVNALAPGILRTEMTRHVWDNPELLQDMVNRTALRRLGEPEDAAYAALLLASDAARFITSQTILVDGGIWPIG
jgi:NAD(P)-dependent dehydrogenase (short-subunit alcohol dehydrogenase family)